MIKIKKLLPVFLMSIMSAATFAADAVVDGIAYYFYDGALEAHVTSNYDNPYTGDIIIPETVDYNGKTYRVTSIGQKAFYECKGLTSVVIGNKVKVIDRWAFGHCKDLTSVTIPNSVKQIVGGSFLNCSALTSLTIPNSVTSIGVNAFLMCSGLESIIVEEGNTVYDSRENCNAIIETAENRLIKGCKNTVIPNTVATIGSHAFYVCYGLKSITIPNSVTTIEYNAFEDCSGLMSLTIGNSVTTIEYAAFSGCSGLTLVTIPNSVTVIYDNAFYDCSSLTSVISLIEEPFAFNSNVFGKSNPETDDDDFTSATLYVPVGTKEKYETTWCWDMFRNIVEGIENAVKSVETDTKETERHNVSGQRISSPQKGLNIVKMSDGTTRKVMCK